MAVKSSMKIKKDVEVTEVTEPVEIAQVIETVEVRPEPTKPSKKQALEKDRQVLCKNVTDGKFVYVSKRSGAEYILAEYGDCEYFEVQELINMKASQPKILTEPWLLIDDDDVVEYLGLTKMYSAFLPVENLNDFFALPIEEMKKALDLAPNGAKSLVASTAIQMIEKGELDSVSKIQFLETFFKMKLTE